LNAKAVDSWAQCFQKTVEKVAPKAKAA